MALLDPVAAYDAASNAEAHLLALMLTENGIEAVAIDDVSSVTFSWLGALSNIHKPQVWIERDSLVRAKPLLEAYEDQLAERRERERQNGDLTNEPIDVVCEECRQQSQFPRTQNGTTQNCPHCNAYVDVGDEALIEGWDEPTIDDPPDSEENQREGP